MVNVMAASEMTAQTKPDDGALFSKIMFPKIP